jgi:transcriptional regulator with XRE-family HTH domain
MDWKTVIRDLVAAGMKQSEIAGEIGAHDSTISEILSGEIKDMYWHRGDALLKLHAERCMKAS